MKFFSRAFGAVVRKAENFCGAIARKSPFKSAAFGWPRDILVFPPWLQRGWDFEKPKWVREVVFLPRRPDRRIPAARPCKLSERPLWRSYMEWAPPDRFVATLEKATVSRNAVIDPRGSLIWPLSYEFLPKPGDHYLLRRPFLGRSRALEGRCLMLTTPEAKNYWHWITDGLQKIKVLEEAGFQIGAFDWILVNLETNNFQRPSLELMGVPMDRVVNTNAHPHLRVEHLTAPSWSEQSGVYDADDLNWLRSRLLKRTVHGGKAFPKRILISRDSAVYRRLLNEKELLEELRSADFEPISLEQLSFEDQISLFHNAEAVIAPHGAGLTNILFCQPGTRVVEIVNPQFAHQMFYYMASVSGLDYRYSTASSSGHREPQKQHLTADVKTIGKLVRQWGLQ